MSASIVTGIVQQSDSRYSLVDLGEVEALLPGSEQVAGERYEHGAAHQGRDHRRHVSGTKGPRSSSRAATPSLIRELFELEVPEIADGLVEITRRRPRARVPLEDRRRLACRGVDPVGACVGPRGSRVRMVVSRAARREDRHHPLERRAARFIAKALSAGARARGARRRRRAAGHGHRARRPALAGHRPRGPERPPGGQADRLARRHQVGVRVLQAGVRRGLRRRGGEDLGGRCHAILANGRRCPKAALPGRATAACDAPPGARGQGLDVVGQAYAAGPSGAARGAASAPRAALHRFATVEGRLAPGPGANLPGRGAGVHPTATLRRRDAARGFQRALRAPVTIRRRSRRRTPHG